MRLAIEEGLPVRDAEGQLWKTWKVARCIICGGTSLDPGAGYSSFAITKEGLCAVPFHRPR